ncbi:hypothetical protein K488DRAFT_72853 [Vararia minispora EC-137]|uniref:Uncharacterized protein n=1 Tax=Vararia minispora EC-137 TaxID=1314806 RepID=A0ACB8QDB9_9AGAM|nr:hypothetical protein K488DRAFT_72853 [Vararia minispora EC-137]
MSSHPPRAPLRLFLTNAQIRHTWLTTDDGALVYKVATNTFWTEVAISKSERGAPDVLLATIAPHSFHPDTITMNGDEREAKQWLVQDGWWRRVWQQLIGSDTLWRRTWTAKSGRTYTWSWFAVDRGFFRRVLKREWVLVDANTGGEVAHVHRQFLEVTEGKHDRYLELVDGSAWAELDEIIIAFVYAAQQQERLNAGNASTQAGQIQINVGN